MATGAPGLSNQNAGVVNAASKKSGKLDIADRPLAGGGGTRTAFDEYSARNPGAPQPGEFGIDARQYGKMTPYNGLRPTMSLTDRSRMFSDRPLGGGGDFRLSAEPVGESRLSGPDLGLRTTALKMQLGIRPGERELRRYAQRQRAEGAGSDGLAGLFSLSASPRAQMERVSSGARVLGGLAGRYGDSEYGQIMERAGAYEDLNLRRFRAEEAATDAAYAPVRNRAQVAAQNSLARQRDIQAQKYGLDLQSAVDDWNAGVLNAKREKTLADARKAQVEAERSAAEWNRAQKAQDAQRMAFDTRLGNGSSNLSLEQIRAIGRISPETANRLLREQYPTVGEALTGSGQRYSVVNDGNRSFIVSGNGGRSAPRVQTIPGGILNEFTGEPIPDYLPGVNPEDEKIINPDAAMYRYLKTGGAFELYPTPESLSEGVKNGDISARHAASLKKFRGWDAGAKSYENKMKKLGF